MLETSSYHSDLPLESLKTLQSIGTLSVSNIEFYINPNCRIQILLDYICNEVDIDKNCKQFPKLYIVTYYKILFIFLFLGNFELCDTAGNLVGIKSLQPWEYATELFKPKSVYVIVFYQSMLLLKNWLLNCEEGSWSENG